MSRKTRKLIWSAPLVAVLAVVGALAIFMTLAPNQAAAQQQEVAPGMPLNLMATELDQTTIKLTWEKPLPSAGGLLDGYRIDYSADNKVWYTRTADVAASATEYVDNDNLKASQMRYYRILAFNTGGSSHAHDPVSATTKPSMKPDAPTALLIAPGVSETDAMHKDNEWLVLTWRAPVNPPGAPVTEYRVQVSKDGSSFTDLESKLSAKDAMCPGTDVDCTYTHKGLFEGTTRTYQVYAKNSVDESAASTKSSGKTNAGNIPGAAKDLRVSVTPAGGMALYWDRPDPGTDDTAKGSGLNDPMYDPNGAPILGYYVMGAEVSNLTDTPVFDGDDEDTEEDTTVAKNEVYYVEANTDLTLTSQVLSRLARFNGTPDPVGKDANGDGNFNDAGDVAPTYWAFRVMAVNKVVQGKVADGTIADADGMWSDGIVVNNAPNRKDTTTANKLRGLPKITKTALHAPSDQGRTGIELAWTVPMRDSTDTTDAPTFRVEYSKDRIDWEVLPNGTVDTFAAPWTGDDTPDNGVVNTGKAGVHRALTAGTRYHYRVFAYQEDTKGTDGKILTRVSSPSALTTSVPNRPEAPAWTTDPNPISETVLRMNFRVHGQEVGGNVDTSVKAVSGTERVGFGVLKGYRIEVSADGKDWTKYRPIMIALKGDPYSHSYSVKYDEATGIPTLTETRLTDPGDNVELTHTNLHQAARRYYRVSTMNNAPGALGYSAASGIKDARTFAAQGADDPAWLVAKAQGRDSIQLLWTARADDITAANIEGYRIESSPLNAEGMCAQDWTDLVEDTMNTDTSYLHSGLAPDTGHCYRVFGINVVGESTGFIGFGDSYINTYDADAQATTYPAVVPGMPMNVMADATSDTEITVTWASPADNGGADITGYVLQRKSGDGEFMTIAATDASTWWNALDCPMMNDAVPADATPAPGSDDPNADPRSPYCEMYDGLAEDAKMVVDATFAANYETITDTSYMDMGLMPETMYYYRVAAMNSVGLGEYSDGTMATTEATDTAPGVPTAVMTEAMSDTHIRVSWTAPDNGGSDITGYEVEYTPDGGTAMTYSCTCADGDANLSATAGVTLMPETEYSIRVRAINAVGNGEWSDAVTATTMAAEAADLTAPTGADASLFAGNSIIVSWDPDTAQNADLIVIALFNADVTALAEIDPNTHPINLAAGDDPGTHSFNNVPAGTYKVGVAAERDGEYDVSIVSEAVTVQ